MVRSIEGKRTYEEWLRGQPSAGDGMRQEPAKANPDSLPAPEDKDTAGREVVRQLLDDPVYRQEFFTIQEHAVFFSVCVDERPLRDVAKEMKKSHVHVANVMKQIRAKIEREIRRREAGLGGETEK